MKFTHSHTSFKSGRLSPKLFNRVDTAQYKNGASELISMRVLPEGGVERRKGTRIFNTTMYNPAETLKQVRTFSIAIAGKQKVIHIKKLTTNQINVNIHTDLSDYSDVETFTYQPASTYDYDLDQLDFAAFNNVLVVTHFSGDIAPLFIDFDVFPASTGLRWMTNKFLNFAFAPHPSSAIAEFIAGGGSFATVGLPRDEYRFPMSDVGEAKSFIRINGFSSATLGGQVLPIMDVTSAVADIVTILQRSPVIYVEGIGHASLDDTSYKQNFVYSDFLYAYQTISGGIRCYSLQKYNWLYNTEAVYSMPHIACIQNTTVELNLETWAYPLFYTANWPKTVTTNEGRLVFGGTPTKPLTIFGSAVNKQLNWCQLKRQDSGNTAIQPYPPRGPVIATDPFVFTVSSKDANEITWLNVAQAMIIGTNRSELVASGGDTILSPLSVNIKQFSGYGSIPVVSATTGKSIYFVGNRGKRLYNFKFNAANGSFISQDLTVLFEDKLEGDLIKSLTWASHLSSIIIIMESGKVYGIMDNDETETLAFYDMGLDSIVSGGALTAPNSSIGDALVLYHEDLGPMFSEQTFYEQGPLETFVKEDTLNENSYMFLDRAVYLRMDLATTNWYWNQEEITVDIGVVPVPDRVFDNMAAPFTGKLIAVNLRTMEVREIDQTFPSIEAGYSQFQANILYDADEHYILGVAPTAAVVATMPIEAGQQWGTAQMGVKHIDTVGVRFYKSYSYELSSDGESWQNVVVADSEGRARTGRQETKFSGNPAFDRIVWIRNTKPEPLTITGVNLKGVSNDG